MFGIATVLTAMFGSLIIISTGSLLAISLFIAFDATRSTLTSRVETLLDDALRLSQTFYQPIETKARWLSSEIVAGHVTPGNTDEFRSVLQGTIADATQISAISYQLPNGTGFFYERAADTLHSVEWPPAWRANLNRNADGPQTWPAVEGQWVLRPSVLDGTPKGTFIVPVRNDEGQDQGLLAFRRNQVPLAQAFAENAEFRDFELVRFVLFNNRMVVGHPELANQAQNYRPSIEELDDAFLRELPTADRQPIAILGDIEDTESFRIDTDEGARIFILQPVRDYVAGGELVVGVHFDANAGSPEVIRILWQAASGIALLIGTVLLAVWLGRSAAAPMGRLARAAELVEAEKLDDLQPLPIGRVRELAKASTAFNGMIEGLRERKRIRDLFGKYVPEDVAALLINDDAASKPRNAVATVFFLDIAGFTAMSERLEPDDVVAAMNAFFSDAVRIIEDHDGMVAQFQGDALLAVFNVPIDKPDHAAAAVHAALAVLRHTEKNTYGDETLKCRIGINTGDVVAGAIGAKDRLSYTVYGDTVNVAARLEAMNKDMGTQLLISASTAERLTDIEYTARGEVSIRGRQASVIVYSVQI